MKTLKCANKLLYLSIFAILSSMSFIACSDDDGMNADPELNIVETAQENEDFSILVQALTDTGLDEPLSEDGTFTVFAPTDAAFEALPDGLLESLSSDQLTQILQYHVLANQVASTDLSAQQAVETLSEETIYVTVNNGEVTINNTATVLTADIETSNGIIHAINGVILPNSFQTIVETAAKNYNLSTLVTLLENANLVSTLSEEGPFTVFAPTNDAFNAVSDVLDGLTSEQVAEVLTYHVAATEALSGDLDDGMNITTVQGEDISVRISGNTVSLNGNATVTNPDLQGTNGVVHIIDAVILPPSFSQNTTEVTQVEIDNVGASAWEFTSIDGNGATAELNTENTNISLEIGQRYTFVNNGGSAHPLDFRNESGDILLSQGGSDGSFEGDSNVDFQIEGNNISFTLTEDLAAEIFSYYCSIHSAMNGSVLTQ
ncbi:MAG: fasciclin domain-containing protein [Gracilimonas sp.]|nr:fasciclin domain-containing protein [Gracilimonas sp.]